MMEKLWNLRLKTIHLDMMLIFSYVRRCITANFLELKFIFEKTIPCLPVWVFRDDVEI